MCRADFRTQILHIAFAYAYIIIQWNAQNTYIRHIFVENNLIDQIDLTQNRLNYVEHLDMCEI